MKTGVYDDLMVLNPPNTVRTYSYSVMTKFLKMETSMILGHMNGNPNKMDERQNPWKLACDSLVLFMYPHRIAEVMSTIL